MAFVSSPSSTNEVNTAYEVSTANTQVNPSSTQVNTASTQVSTANLSDATVYPFLANQPNESQLVHEDLEQIYEDDLKEMDFKCYMEDDEVPTNMSLMAFSDSEFNKSEFNLATYKRGLASVEEQLVFHKKNKLEKLKQEKESNQLKIENFDNASKNLEKLIGSQITNNSRKCVGFVSYNVVSPPHTGLFSPPKLDLSNSGLEEFQQYEFEGYGPKTSKSVSEDICNEVRESPDAPLVEELVSNDKLEKKTVFPTVAKIEFVRPKQQEKLVRKPVKYAEMYRPNLAVVNVVRENQVNAIKASACWVWRPTKLNSGHPQKEDQGYVDSGCSRHMTGNMSYLSDFKEFDGGYVTFRGGAKGGRITGKGTLKTGKLDFEDVYFVKEL
ncbi:hypothetical protein Tco_1531326 [Tanacetum coccineum]